MRAGSVVKTDEIMDSISGKWLESMEWQYVPFSFGREERLDKLKESPIYYLAHLVLFKK